MKKVLATLYKFAALVVSVLLVTIGVACSLVAISYGEFMITTTGNMLWALFYIPHAIALVWYVKYRSKGN